MKKILTSLFLVNLFLTFSSFSEAIGSISAARKNEIKKAEVQFEVCEQDANVILTKLGLPPSSSEFAQIMYYDTPQMDLLRRDVVIKLKKSDNKMKSTAKIKNINLNEIPWDFLEGHDYKCERDVYLNLDRISCSLNHKVDSNNVVSKYQFELIKMLRFDLSKSVLEQLGPVDTFEYKVINNSLELVVEQSQVRGTVAAIELSTKVPVENMQKTQAEIFQMLKVKNINLCTDQHGKIKKIFALLKQ